MEIPIDKSDYFKFDIKDQSEERESETVTIYVLLFWTGITEVLLNFVTKLHKITRGQDLSTGPQTLEMTLNLVVGESL